MRGRRFDFRFYALVHGGRLYMHRNALVKWGIDGALFDPASAHSLPCRAVLCRV